MLAAVCAKTPTEWATSEGAITLDDEPVATSWCDRGISAEVNELAVVVPVTVICPPDRFIEVSRPVVLSGGDIDITVVTMGVTSGVRYGADGPD